MSLTVVITRDVQNRYRGFLGSVMLEVSAGVYISPRLNAGVRNRIWNVMSDWHGHLQRGAIIMSWSSPEEPGGVGLRILGEPPKTLSIVDGVLLVRRIAESSDSSLTN